MAPSSTFQEAKAELKPRLQGLAGTFLTLAFSLKWRKMALELLYFGLSGKKVKNISNFRKFPLTEM